MIRQLTAFGLTLGLLAVLGCGGGLTGVECEVTLDGTAVSGATVTFAPDAKDGTMATGFTDTSGRCVMQTAGKAGVKAGSYKVMVTKIAAVAGDPEKMKPGSPDYMKEMQKHMAKGGPAGGAGGGAPQASKSELPLQYGSAEKTPISCTVPTSEKPFKIALKK